MMLIALLLAQAAAAETPPAKPAKDQNKVVCRASGITGSRLGGQRICRTRAEWVIVDREQQQATGQAQANARRN